MINDSSPPAIGDWLSNLVLDDRPELVIGPFGKHGVSYETDEDGYEYALVGFNVENPHNHNSNPCIRAEIDDQTYGELVGFRLYYDIEED